MSDLDSLLEGRRGLGPIVVDLLRLVATLRAEYRAASELLGIALEQMADLNAELDRVRGRHRALLDERRRERPPSRRRAA